ncbi:MAG: RNA-binding protein [Methylococcales bacterium]|nr:RNA-binding protein [Methylococcales bacterium]MBT7442829.1 RNA-binding protein [Methylococcales bacterium]
MPTLDKLRIDKWLWAARFFKTRALAADAVQGGKVHIDGQRCKPSKNIVIGMQVSITKGDLRWSVTVLGINKHRRPASEAQLLYEESEQSLQTRLDHIALKKLQPTLHSPKPDKKGRRQIHSFTGKH